MTRTNVRTLGLAVLMACFGAGVGAQQHDGKLRKTDTHHGKRAKARESAERFLEKHPGLKKELKQLADANGDGVLSPAERERLKELVRRRLRALRDGDNDGQRDGHDAAGNDLRERIADRREQVRNKVQDHREHVRERRAAARDKVQDHRQHVRERRANVRDKVQTRRQEHREHAQDHRAKHRQHVRERRADVREKVGQRVRDHRERHREHAGHRTDKADKAKRAQKAHKAAKRHKRR